MSVLDRAALDLALVREHLADLRADIAFGVRRRRYASGLPLSEEMVVARDALAREERAERSELALGHRPVPCNVFLLDVETAIVDGLLELEQAVRDRLGQPRRARARSQVRWACLAVEQALDTVGADPALDDLAGHITSEVARMAALMRDSLGLADPPLVLRAGCPYCGAELVARTETVFGPVISCDGDDCDPASWTPRWRGRPVWTIDDWGGLAALLRASEAGAA